MKLPKVGKRTFKNKEELNCYKYLQEHLPEGMVVEYETESLPYTTQHTYTPDFPIKFTKGGTQCYLEYKGNGRAFDNTVRQKMIAVKKQYPLSKFYIVFHSDGKIGPKRKDGTFLRQSDWAKKNGFEYCIGTNNIPKEWFIV